MMRRVFAAGFVLFVLGAALLPVLAHAQGTKLWSVNSYDEMEKGSRSPGQSAWDLTTIFTDSFIVDMPALNLLAPDVLCRATDHIAEPVEFIADLERGGYTYRTSDGIYFDTSKQSDYGYLARLDRAGLEAGKRVDMGEKRSPTDFALWKFSPAGEKRQMEWPSPWGTGFPGWQI